MLKIAVINDEPVFAEKMKNLALTYFRTQHMDVDVKTYLQPGAFLSSDLAGWDVVFLDVGMEECDGIKVAYKLREENKNALLIYVSGLVESATRGYEVSAFRYLLKSDLDVSFKYCMAAAMEQAQVLRDLYPLRIVEGETVHIPLHKLLYFESRGAGVDAHVQEKERMVYRARKRISSIEEELVGKGFLRIHRGFLVNMRHITVIKNYEAKLSTGEKLAVGVKNYSAVRAIYTKWKGVEE